MKKLTLEDFDSLLKKESAEIPSNGTGQLVNSHQTGENSSKPPALRAPIDKLIGVAGTALGGTAALAAGVARIQTKVPMRSVN